MHAHIRDCPNQVRGKIRVCLPKTLNSRWCKHIGDDNAKAKYEYSVAAAVSQAGSTREVFTTCWRKYQRSAKSKDKKQFHEDVFQRFCDAGFGQTTDDGEARRLKFVRWILTAKPEPVQVRFMFVRRCVHAKTFMCEYGHVWYYVCDTYVRIYEYEYISAFSAFV